MTDAAPDRAPRQNGAADETIDLQDWMKLEGLVRSGGEAKMLIQEGYVRLNGETETRRRRKLRRGDTVEFDERTFQVDW